MKNNWLNKVVILAVAIALSGASVYAQDKSQTDGVVMKDGQMMVMKDGKSMTMKRSMTMSRTGTS
jgi:hypothetical protein